LSNLYYIFAALLIWFSYKSFRSGIDYLNYFKQELKKPLDDYTPFATIFAPCRGIDQGMLENLDALLAQDYPEFEVVFIVDEQDDDATKLIERAWQEARRPVKLVVAPKATDSSQKVTNLREGIQYADPASEIFAFVDSDARPSKQWLRNLVAPLTDPQIGATTGYRWFISEHNSLASEMRNMWNASIASHQGSNRKTNFCWGGATAIKRSTFEQLEICERWHGTVSDDFTLTRAVHEAGLDIHFVPRALTASIEDCSWRELFEFTTRQMTITRVYSQKLWVLSFVGSGLFTVTMIASLLIIILSRKNDWPVAAALFTLVIVTLFSIGKSLLRLKAVQLVLPEYATQLRRQSLPQMTLWCLTPFVFLFNCIAAWMSRRITWRGTVYEMVSSRETKVISNLTQ
jgi:cellulose synthase/poly-beta-1,6-N-acetylglucosamine synthase-like glycosyltransferase